MKRNFVLLWKTVLKNLDLFFRPHEYIKGKKVKVNAPQHVQGFKTLAESSEIRRIRRNGLYEVLFNTPSLQQQYFLNANKIPLGNGWQRLDDAYQKELNTFVQGNRLLRDIHIDLEAA